MKSLLRKLVLFITGYALYIAIEVTFRGYSYVLMGLCGGVLLMFIDEINEILPWDTDILLQSSLGSVLITFFELTVGEACKISNIDPMWDYSNMLFNFDGVICLEFSLLWVILSFVAILLADAINYYVFKLEPLPYYKLFGRTIIKFKEYK